MDANKEIINDIVSKINEFFNQNKQYTKKELETTISTLAKNAYDKFKNKAKGKGKKEDKEGIKEDKEDIKEDKPKRELTKYQIFMKEQMAILKARENAKGDGEEKISPKNLMREIGEMWKAQKEA